MHESIQRTSRETVPPKHIIASKKWMPDTIRKLMNEKRKENQDEEEYGRLHKEYITPILVRPPDLVVVVEVF